MIFLEVALQGIRGFSPLTRFTLRPGMNVGIAKDPLVRRALLDAMYHALYPDPTRTAATSKLAEPSAKESRIALTFFGRDRGTYRIVREAVSGAVSLHKFEPTQSKFAMLTRSAQETAQFVRVQEQIPDDASYERLFMFSPETMPSLGEGAKTRSGVPIASRVAELRSPSGPGLPVASTRPTASGRPGSLMAAGPPHARAASSAGSGIHAHAMRQPSIAGGARGPQPPRGKSTFGSAYGLSNALAHAEMVSDAGGSTGDLDPEQLEQKRVLLVKLKNEAGYARRGEHSQVELDALNARRNELLKKVERVAALELAVAELQREADEQDDVLDLSHGFSDRLKRHEELHARYLIDRSKAGDERHEIERYLFEHPMLVLTQDLYFLSGIALAGVAIACSVMMQKPIIALFNIPCVLVAAAAAFRWVGDLEYRARTKLRLNAVVEREQRVQRQYDLDTSAVRRVFDKLGVDTHDLRARIEAAEQVKHRLKAAEAELAMTTAAHGIADAKAELAQITRQIEKVESIVLGSQGILSSETLDRKIAVLERDIAEAERSSDATVIHDPGAQGQPPRATMPPRSSTSQLPRSTPKGGTPIIQGVPATLERSSSRLGGTKPSSPAVRAALESPVAPKVNPAGPRPPSPRPASPSSETMFDFGGGEIGSGEDEEQGYGSGYGAPSRGGGKPGSKTSSRDEHPSEAERDRPAPLWAIGIGGGGSDDDASGLAGAYSEESGSGRLLGPDRSRDVVRAAVDLLQIPTDDVPAKLGTRLKQYLTAFTDQRYDAAMFGARGEMSVVPAGGGAPIPFMELPDPDLDLVDSALRFALLEACIAHSKIPVLIDDPFLGFPAAKRMLFSQMVSYLANATQIFLLTENEDVTGHEVKW